MRCGHCHGSGKEPRKDVNGTSRYTDEPCCECGGSGIAHCCDGICEQPDGTSNNRPSLRAVR